MMIYLKYVFFVLVGSILGFIFTIFCFGPVIKEETNQLILFNKISILKTINEEVFYKHQRNPNLDVGKLTLIEICRLSNDLLLEAYEFENVLDSIDVQSYANLLSLENKNLLKVKSINQDCEPEF